MTFQIAQKTLERLEWPEVLAQLRACCRTPRARARLAPVEDAHGAGGAVSLFESGLLGVRERLAETSEARSLLDRDEIAPLGGVADLAPTFRRAELGGVLAPQQLLEVGATLSAIHATRRFLSRFPELAPRLAAIADVIEEDRELAASIERSIDSGGEVRDSASPALREARAETARLSAELQKRLARYLQNPGVSSALSDDYYTVRNDRYVLPVRADARSKVPGIVHDASGSGTTLFVEPEGVVELNNRHKQAELAAVRETERVLRDLSSRVAAASDTLESGLCAMEEIDLAFARGELSRRVRGVEPEVADDGVFSLPQLRHPLIDPDEAVPNDLHLGEGFTVMVISGPNGGGKTVAMKAVGLAALSVRAGLHVPADRPCRIDLVDTILADIGDEQDIRESLSTFSAHMANLSEIVRDASKHALVVLDEVGVGTDPGEGAALGQAILERLADAGARVIATTHYNLLKEMAAVDQRFCNASVEFDPETLAPTYRLHMGTPGVSSATAVAARMGMPGEVLERANSLLEREDRRLDRMLTELASSRASLDREQREVRNLREQGERARDEYRDKLERLQERRDQLYHAMREDLDRAFSDAHAQVAGVIRDLQRGGGARDATHAQQQLQALEAQSRDAEREAGVQPKPRDGGRPVDWRRASPGDTVTVAGGGRGILETLPDRRGRVTVRARGAKLVVAADQVGAVEGPAVEKPRPAPVETISDSPIRGGTDQCDLRGQRVEEALDQLADALDRASRSGRDTLRVIHGFGTGALRKAVREHLERSPYVANILPGERDQGGDGVTLAELRG